MTRSRMMCSTELLNQTAAGNRPTTEGFLVRGKTAHANRSTTICANDEAVYWIEGDGLAYPQSQVPTVLAAFERREMAISPMRIRAMVVIPIRPNQPSG